jgi:NAD(P)-dependent dehydrogenase (short-subunit alcohol dehydrogenase family)
VIVTSRSPAVIEGVAEVITGNIKTENALGRFLLFFQRAYLNSWVRHLLLNCRFLFCETILGIEMTDNKCGDKLAAALKGQEIDILINNAGYFYEPVEKIDSLNFEEVTTRAILLS